MSFSSHSDLDNVPVASYPLGGVLVLFYLYANYSFRPQLNCCAQGQKDLFPVSQCYVSPLCFTELRVGLPLVICLCLSCCSMNVVQKPFSQPSVFQGDLVC